MEAKGVNIMSTATEKKVTKKQEINVPVKMKSGTIKIKNAGRYFAAAVASFEVGEIGINELREELGNLRHLNAMDATISNRITSAQLDIEDNAILLTIKAA